jgi:hypothetical protein
MASSSRIFTICSSWAENSFVARVCVELEYKEQVPLRHRSHEETRHRILLEHDCDADDEQQA